MTTTQPANLAYLVTGRSQATVSRSLSDAVLRRADCRDDVFDTDSEANRLVESAGYTIPDAHRALHAFVDDGLEEVEIALIDLDIPPGEENAIATFALSDRQMDPATSLSFALLQLADTADTTLEIRKFWIGRGRIEADLQASIREWVGRNEDVVLLGRAAREESHWAEGTDGWVHEAIADADSPDTVARRLDAQAMATLSLASMEIESAKWPAVIPKMSMLRP